MVVVGVLISFLLQSLMPVKTENHNPLYDIFTSVFITILLWEGNLRIDSIMNKYFPWISKPGRRILIHLPVSLIFSVLGILLPMMFFSKFLCELPPQFKEVLMATSIVIGILVTIIILSIEIGTQFFSQWKNSLVEVEKYKTESVQAQLQNLKDHVNPHFLFNNLSVLSSLVYKDQDKAVEFINQLSKVYRYLLDNRSAELITVEEELKFISSYTFLLKIRFDSSIDFKIDIPTHKQNLYVPPMALQILIENAIKHNEVSSENPLIVHVTESEGQIEVKNNLQLRKNADKTSGTGLQNIKDRYNYYTNKTIEIVQNENTFSVKIPLLNKS